MKFTGGYVLGALTVVGMGVSFVAGIVACDWTYSKKQEAASKISDATVASVIGEYIKAKRN
jgi:hypothetical protein